MPLHFLSAFIYPSSEESLVPIPCCMLWNDDPPWLVVVDTQCCFYQLSGYRPLWLLLASCRSSSGHTRHPRMQCSGYADDYHHLQSAWYRSSSAKLKSQEEHVIPDMSEAKVDDDLRSVTDMQDVLWCFLCEPEKQFWPFECCQFSPNLETHWLSVRKIFHHKLEIHVLTKVTMFFFPSQSEFVY